MRSEGGQAAAPPVVMFSNTRGLKNDMQGALDQTCRGP